MLIHANPYIRVVNSVPDIISHHHELQKASSCHHPLEFDFELEL